MPIIRYFRVAFKAPMSLIRQKYREKVIRVLKRIREKMIANGKVRRYLLYALGEILLVVFGILIALQLNNWNESRLAQIEVNNYIINLKNALNDDISSIRASNSYNSFRLNGVFYLLEHADLDTSRFTEIKWANTTVNDENHTMWTGPYPDTLNRDFTIKIFSTIGRGFGSASFNKSVINELYSTGSFSNIKNDELKQNISAYYRYLNQRLEGYAIQEHEEWANETTRFLRDRYGIFTLDVSGLEDPIETIRGKKDVEHYLRYLALEINYHIVWGAKAIDMATDIIELIDQETTNS